MTIGDPQSFNRYSYVGNDPVNLIDPTGLMCYARFEVWSVNGRESWTFLGTWCEPNNSSPASPATAFSHEPTHGLPRDTMSGGQQQRQFDSNSEFCKSLLQKISNIGQDILKREREYRENPQNLPMVGPIGAPLRSDGFGHLKIIMDAYNNYNRRIQEYTDKCGGPPPGVPISRSPSANQSSSGNGINREAAAKAAGTVGLGLAIYFILRTTGRIVFPLSNLVPIP
jgi:hypothetical protein